VGDTQ